MTKSLILTAILAGAVCPVAAQTKIAPSRQYGSSEPQGVDKNFSLPSFGMKGSELPQQRTTAPEPLPRDGKVPDFFENIQSGQPLSGNLLPGERDPMAADKPPAFGTADSSGSGDSTGSETPLFTTNEGGTTGETASPDETK